MTVKEIIESLKNINRANLAEEIKKTIAKDPVDFTLDDISCLIFEEYESLSDSRLLILEKDIQKNGILLY